ncbi:N4-gp56 family major capsid protein [Acinetobacter sp. ULE_I010]|uniref:N4-gp56 family major capsid protein n=1 Tax=Acinetobacter sp. ULE_I010 TaxID=3373065 RepID=UPI003AF8D293
MSKTNTAYGGKMNMVTQAVGLFATHMNRNSTLNLLSGKMPAGEAGAEATLRKQTTSHMPIVRVQDLGKGKGDEVTFNLLNPVGGYPIMGSAYAEGRGVGMSLSEDKLRVNQARFPIDLGNVMSQIRSPADLRKLGKPLAQSQMDAYCDQSLLVHMAGARGYHDNIEWRVPTDAHANFSEIMVNKVKAPTKNRHFFADGAGISSVRVNSGEAAFATTDMFTMDTVDSMKTFLDEMALPPPIVKFEGDVAAEDSPLRVWLVSPSQYNKFSTQPGFRAFQGAALVRAGQAKQHPLFLGEVGLWNGFLIRKMPRPIRFYAGDTIKYCADYTSETESGIKVPASFGEKFAVDRSIILGGQAVAEALAASDKSGVPFFWSEKEMDHGDKWELLIGSIRGVSKIRFDVNTGTRQEFTDYGVTVVDTAVACQGRGQ